MGDYANVRSASNYFLAAVEVAREGNLGLARYFADKSNKHAALAEARPMVKATAALVDSIDRKMATEVDAQLLIENPTLVIEPPLDRLRRTREQSPHWAEFLRCREVLG